MSFLSLGLSKDEQENQSSAVGRPLLADEGSGTGSAAATKSFPGGSPASSDVAEEHEISVLPPAVEELRLKIAGNAYKPVFRRPASDGTPTFATFKFGYVPGKGLLYSTIAHELALFLLFMMVRYGFPALRAQQLITQNSQDHVIFLPEMGGGREGEKSPGGGLSQKQEQSSAPAHASKGFAYPGKQSILSDPPNADNVFQTLQRPLVVRQPRLNQLVPLPNIVQMAETRLPKDLVAPKAAMPQLQPVPQAIKVKRDSLTHRDAPNRIPTNDPPQLVAKAEMPKLPAAEEPLPQTPKLEVPPKQEEEDRQVEKPSPKPLKVTAEKRAEKRQTKDASPLSQAQVAKIEMHGKAPEPLLSLSAMPPPPGSNATIPNAEARGRFALAPGGTLNPNSLTPGKNNMPLSTTPGMGSDKSQVSNAATEVASNAGAGSGHSPSLGGGKTARDGIGTGSAGVGFGSGNTVGQGAGGEGKGNGRGAEGRGAGANSGRGAGTGAGGGSGPGSGAFQGITIQGGEYGNANANSISIATSNDAPSYAIEKQEAYRMTVVATAASGGGLADYGVFHDERVFTVYIPMKRAPEEEDPTWTLQYSVLKDDPANPVGDQTVLAPSPVAREWPEISPALLKRYAHRQVVLYTTVNQEGKIGSITVKQTPDAGVSTPIIQALSKWVFRPAQLNDKPVAVKVLIGIQLQ